MKIKLTFVMLFLFAGIVSIQAQQQGFQNRTVEERVKFTMARLSDSLQLSETAKGSVDSAFTDYYKAMDKLREGLAPGTRPAREDMQKIAADRDAKLKLVMTEEQFKKFKDNEEKMRQQRMQRQGGGNN